VPALHRNDEVNCRVPMWSVGQARVAEKGQAQRKLPARLRIGTRGERSQRRTHAVVVRGLCRNTSEPSSRIRHQAKNPAKKSWRCSPRPQAQWRASRSHKLCPFTARRCDRSVSVTRPARVGSNVDKTFAKRAISSPIGVLVLRQERNLVNDGSRIIGQDCRGSRA